MEVKITQEQVNAAYATADDNQKKLLDALFGKQKVEDNRPVTERVKTFEDAVRELGDNNPFVQAYYNNALFDTDKDNRSEISDIIAYLKLRIIVAALNEGWTPEFVGGEYRWVPWFILYTNGELANMKDKDKEGIRSCRVVGRSYYNAHAYGGLAYAYADFASSGSYANYGSRLAFRTEELAEYAGKQFIGIYAQMMGLELV